MRELLNAIDDPLASVFMVLSGKGVNAAEKGTTDTS
jgi:hypothetical protein